MIQGIDVSHWNGLGDWQQARAAGVGFAYIRAGSITSTSGELYPDTLLDEHTDGAIGAGIPFGYYFYMRPKFDGRRQAEYFVKLMREVSPQPDVLLPPWIDVEEPASSKYAARDSITNFVEVLENAGYSDPMIYTRQGYWDYNVEASNLWPQLRLAAARYSSALTSPWSDGRFKFRDWTDWTFWQYSADGNALAKTYGFPGYPNGDNDIDLDWYNGNDFDFYSEFGVYPARPEEEQPQEIQIVRVTAPTYLNVRNAPGGADLGDVKAGLEFYAYEFQLAGAYTWARIGHTAWIAIGPGLAEVVE